MIQLQSSVKKRMLTGTVKFVIMNEKAHTDLYLFILLSIYLYIFR